MQRNRSDAAERPNKLHMTATRELARPKATMNGLRHNCSGEQRELCAMVAGLFAGRAINQRGRVTAARHGIGVWRALDFSDDQSGASRTRLSCDWHLTHFTHSAAFDAAGPASFELPISSS